MGSNWSIIPLSGSNWKQTSSHRENQSDCFVFTELSSSPATLKDSSVGHLGFVLCCVFKCVCALLSSNFSFHSGYFCTPLPHARTHRYTHADFAHSTTSCCSAELESQPKDSRMLMRFLAGYGLTFSIMWEVCLTFTAQINESCNKVGMCFKSLPF